MDHRGESWRFREEAEGKQKQTVYLFETGSQYVTQAGLEFVILLLQSLEYWDHRLVP